MNYIRIDDFDMLNGDGCRVILWVAGCNHHCKNCHNPETWDCNAGQLFDNKAKEYLFECLSKDYIQGLTFTGGDPLFPGNRETVTQLAKEVKEKFPNKDIWMWTGYKYEEVADLEVMKYVDVLIDGEYVEELRDIDLHWRGSSNQVIYYLNK